MPKLIIVKPDSNIIGGVSLYYDAIIPHLPKEIIISTIGKRINEKVSAIRIIRDFLNLLSLINKYKNANILINPSLDKMSFLRDGFIMLFLNLLNRKVIVFFRGWEISLEEKISRNLLLKFIINNTFGKASFILVLSTDFREKLFEWGIDKSKILLETTTVDQSLLKDFIFKTKSSVKNLLFISRLEKGKGIYIAIDTVEILTKKGYNINMNICGIGPEFDNVKKYIYSRSINNIKLCGSVIGKNKADILKESDIFIFPTCYGEGMPNSVLEAMAFGLPIITRTVGGLKDFFIDGEMGYITDSINAEVFAELTIKLIENQNLYDKISTNNYFYAENNFYSSVVAKRISEKCID